MKADENAVGVEKRAAKAFYPELADEGEEAFDLLQQRRKAEPAVARPVRFDDEQEKRGKSENWHAFQTP
jgi:hypothetical protein